MTSSTEHARIFVGLARRQDNDGLPYWQSDWLVETLAAAFDQVRADEREACAEIAREYGEKHGYGAEAALDVAERARGDR